MSEKRTFEDGRPCETDVFLAALLDQMEDDHDFRAAVKDWVEGDWDGAMHGIKIEGITK